jgi:phosphatidylglycerophosphate synthase
VTAGLADRRTAPRTESVAQTVRRLSSAQKGAAGAPAYSRFVNRPAGRVLAALAHRAHLTPNAVTGLSAVATLSGLAVLVTVRPSWWAGPVVAASLLLGSALDSADGQLARLRGGGSPAGEWLDHMVDAVKASSLHLAVLVGLFRFGTVDSGALLLVPLGYCVVDAVTYFGTMLNESLRARHGAPTRAQPSAVRAGIRRSLLNLPTDYGLLCLVLALVGLPAVFLPAYTLMFTAAAGYLVLASGKWFREMGGLAT